MQGMTLIVKQVTKLVSGFIFLFAIYHILLGHISPGGGFVGGVAIGCGLILLILSYGKEYFNTLIKDRTIVIGFCLGAIAFLLLALVGYCGGTFFEDIWAGYGGKYTILSGGTIPLMNIAIGITVGACLVCVFVALIVFHQDLKSAKGEE